MLNVVNNKETRLWMTSSYLITIILSVSLFLVLLGDNNQEGPWLWYMPLFLMLFCVFTALRALSLNWKYILSPITMFLVTVGVFYGFGPLIYKFGNSSSVAWLDHEFPVNSSMLFKTNFLIEVGLVFTLLGITVTSFKKGRLARHNKKSSLTVNKMVLILLLIGIPLKYFVVFPYMMGFVKFIPAGSLISLSDVTYVAILLLAYKTTSKLTKYSVLLYLLLATEIIMGVLCLDKTWIILPIMSAVIGRTISTRRKSTVLKGVLLVSLIYVLVAPLALTARIELNLLGSKSFGSAIAAIQYALNNHSSLGDSTTWWWVRLCYVPQEALAVSLHDAGYIGKTILQPLSWLLIPRVIDPSKPVLNLAQQFSILLDGNSHNNMSPGVYADMYWNYGWLGVVILSFLIGVLLGVLHKFAMRVITNEQWILIPVVLNAVLLAEQGALNFLVEDFIVQILYLVGESILLLFIGSLFTRTRSMYDPSFSVSQIESISS